MVAYPSLRPGAAPRPYHPVLGLLTAWAILGAGGLTLVCLGIRPAAADEPVSAVRLAGPPGAQLTIDDRTVGTFPLTGPLTLAPGEYRVEATLPGYQPFEQTLAIDDSGGDRYLRVRLDPYRRKHAWTSNLLFAGLGQHYLDKPVKGYAFNLVEAAGLLITLTGQARYDNYKQDYLLLQDAYNTAINAEEIATYKAATDEAYSQMEDAENLRNTGLLVAAGAIVVSIIDVLLFFPEVEAGPGPVPPVVGRAMPAGPGPADDPWRSIHAGVALKF
jgi:hypothetical protein